MCYKLNLSLFNVAYVSCCVIVLINVFNINDGLLESLFVVMSSFGPEGLELIPDAPKDPPSACNVRACKIYGSKTPVHGLQEFTMGDTLQKNFSSFETEKQIAEVEKNGASICHKRLKSDLCRYKLTSLLRKCLPLP